MQGCREKTDKFNPNPKDWSAFRSTDYGYTRMQLVNTTHLYLEQVSDDQVRRLAQHTHKHSRGEGMRLDENLSQCCLIDNKDFLMSSSMER